MPSFEDLRTIALSLPRVHEDRHFEGPAFRVGNRKFALLWVPTQQTILKLPPGLQAQLFKDRPEAALPIRVGTVFWAELKLTSIKRGELEEWVTQAWTTVVTKKLARAYLDEGKLPEEYGSASPLR